MKTKIPVKYSLIMLPLVYSFLFIIGFLFVIDYLADPPITGIIGLSALCASIFIFLVRPESKAANLLHFYSGFLIAIVVGIIFHYLISITGNNVFSAHNSLLFEILSSASVIVTISIFFILKIDHPPAIGMTLGLVLEAWTMESIVVLVIAILLVSLIKLWINPRTINHMK